MQITLFVLLTAELPRSNIPTAELRNNCRDPIYRLPKEGSYDNEDEYIFPALRAGALSYVLKDVGPEELADTVRMAARGESVLHPRVASRVVQELRGTKRDTPNIFTDLSDRELEVLRLIADGLSNAEIANKLVISEKTVKGHVSNILSKLHMMDRTQAAVFAWQQGFVSRREV